MKLHALASFVSREVRGGAWRALFFALCIAIGVAAVASVASLAGGLEGALRSQSRELLAADLSVRARRPLPPELDEALARHLPGSTRIDVRELATMVGRAGADGAVERSLLCELKVVEPGYPFYGSLTLTPAGTLDALLSPDAVVVAPEVLERTGVELGGALSVGGARFRVAGLVEGESDRLGFSMTLGPRVFLSRAGFDRTRLDVAGNRVNYRALLKTPEDLSEAELARVVTAVRGDLEDASYLRIESHFDAQPAVRQGLARFRSYLGLVALLSLILGGIGVAQIVRTWLASRLLPVAVWKTLGLTRRELVALHAAHVVTLALAGSLVGIAAGAALPPLLARLAPDLLPAGSLSWWQPVAFLRGLGLGVGVALVFALPGLAALGRIPPAVVLRQLEPPPPSRRERVAVGTVLLGGVFLTAWVQGEDAWVGALFTGGLALFGLVLWLAARAFVALAGRVPRERLGPGLAYALAALARPGSGTVGGVVALGLGAMVVGAMVSIEDRLSSALRGALPEEAPSLFLVDVQTDQWEGVRELLEGAGGSGVDSVPVSMARLKSVDGVSVRELSREGDGEERRGNWRLTREQRLTWWEELPTSNRLVAGELWSQPGVDEVSLEVDFAENIGAALGSVLVFDLQGVPVEVVVTSLREVEWQSFQINFFVVVEPGLLDAAPQVRLAAARVPEASEEALQDELARAYPNVTLLRVRPILMRVAALLERIALGVQVLGAFTIIAGVVILIGAVAATRLGRAREVALMKTLGVTRGRILRLFAVEFALGGTLAGALGALGAWTLSRGFLQGVLRLGEGARWEVLWIVGGATAAVAVAAGLAASRGALIERPRAVLEAREG